MFFDSDICGNRLPDKVLCLTFDDGPGPQTLEVARYLFERRICATFFVIGSQAALSTSILRQLHAWNHTIGNHTFHHPGLAREALQDNDVTSEILAAELIIQQACPDVYRFLRAPYGSWREVHRSATGGQGIRSIVARQLNGMPELRHYVGHIHWDICTCDYDFWRSGASVEQCAENSLDLIRSVGRGIVLLHDGSEDAGQRALNRTCELTKQIVPVLLRDGFRFVSLNQVPQVRSALGCRLLGRLKCDEGRTLGLSPEGSLSFGEPGPDHADQWGIVPRNDREAILRSPNGCFLTAEALKNGLTPGAPSTDDSANIVISRETGSGDLIHLNEQLKVTFEMDLFNPRKVELSASKVYQTPPTLVIES